MVVAGSSGDVKIDNVIKSIPPVINAMGGFLATNLNIADTNPILLLF